MRPRAKHQPESPFEQEAGDDLAQQAEPQRTTAGSQQVPVAGSTTSWGVVYATGQLITGGIAFLICWIYAIATFGVFIGVGLGWIPSLVIGGIAGVLWPLIAFLIAVVIVVVIVVVIYAVDR